MTTTPPGLIASGHPVTTAAAAEVLSAGGNAFDAVVAAGFAGSVAEPMLTSMAGGGFCLVHTADGLEHVVDFFVDVPGLGRDGAPPGMREVTVAFTSTTQVFHVGWGSVAVPGCLAGWLHVHERHGRLPLAAVVAPAQRAAAEGVVVNDQQAYLFRILAPVTTTSEVVGERFAPDGRPLAAGATLVQADVAAFLHELGQDRDAAVDRFRAAVVEGASIGQGALTDSDLEGYEVIERAPLLATYRDHELCTNDAPGGRLIADQLAVLAEEPPFSGWDDPTGPLRCVRAQLAAEAVAARAATQGTTHVSVADGEGNVAAMTTSNGTGSGQSVPGIGVVLNNMLGEDDLFPDGLGSGVPGQRISSMMSPSLVRRDGSVVLVLGSGGSKRIRTAMTQVVARHVDHGADLEPSVRGPRVHHDGSVAQVEPGFPQPAIEALRAAFPVNEWSAVDLYFGGVHAVVPGQQAAGDPRRGGSTARV